MAYTSNANLRDQSGRNISAYKKNNGNINIDMNSVPNAADNYRPNFQSQFNKNQADNYGLTYGYDAIKSKFDAATKASYDVQRQQAAQNENQYYQQAYTGQQTALDTLKKSQAAAIASGASRGAQAANALSSTLAGQQESTAQATKLAQDRANLNAQEQEAYAQNAQNAMSTANELGQNLYSADTQFNLGQMEYYSSADAAAKSLQGQIGYNNAYMYAADQEANSNMYAANRNYDAAAYTADQGLKGTKYNANKNYKGTKYNANKNYKGTKYNADSNVKSSQITANAYKK